MKKLNEDDILTRLSYGEMRHVLGGKSYAAGTLRDDQCQITQDSTCNPQDSTCTPTQWSDCNPTISILCGTIIGPCSTAGTYCGCTLACGKPEPSNTVRCLAAF